MCVCVSVTGCTVYTHFGCLAGSFIIMFRAKSTQAFQKAMKGRVRLSTKAGKESDRENKGVKEYN